jgi:hypothetical protein
VVCGESGVVDFGVVGEDDEAEWSGDDEIVLGGGYGHESEEN